MIIMIQHLWRFANWWSEIFSSNKNQSQQRFIYLYCHWWCFRSTHCKRNRWKCSLKIQCEKRKWFSNSFCWVQESFLVEIGLFCEFSLKAPATWWTRHCLVVLKTTAPPLWYLLVLGENINRLRKKFDIYLLEALDGTRSYTSTLSSITFWLINYES